VASQAKKGTRLRTSEGGGGRIRFSKKNNHPPRLGGKKEIGIRKKGTMFKAKGEKNLGKEGIRGLFKLCRLNEAKTTLGKAKKTKGDRMAKGKRNGTNQPFVTISEKDFSMKEL